MRPTAGMLLSRLRELLGQEGRAPSRVRRREIGLLEGELGRPLPAELRIAWETFGAGRIGTFRLSGAAELSQGVALLERWFDEALLPIGHAAAGDLYCMTLGQDADPEIIFAAAPPGRARLSLGRLSRVLEALALEALLRQPIGAEEQERLAGRLARLDPDARMRDPAGFLARAESA